MTRILVLVGHPRADSLCAALGAAYAAAAEAAGHPVRRLMLNDVPVDLALPDFGNTAPRPGWIGEVQDQLSWCEHLVLVTPLWWGSVPAALKALFDRVLLPGFAFRYRPKGAGWDKLLAGRSARILLTTDTPPWVLRWLIGRPVVHQLRKQVLGFCGFAPVRAAVFGPVRGSSEGSRKAWLAQVAALGGQGT